MSFLGHKSYGQAIAEGNYSNIIKWSKIGFLPNANTTESDVWSYGGTVQAIPLKTGDSTIRVVSANAADVGTVIKGDATGNTVQADSGGTTTSLVDADGAFTSATAVDNGDLVILDPHGTSPEWGYVTGVTADTLTVAGGFSKGGSGASRYYAVVDYSNQAGAHAVYISYVDSSYAAKSEIIVTTVNSGNGTVSINADYYRINEFRVIATGSGTKPTGALSLGDNASPPTIIYSYITAGFTRARNTIYTVPAGKTLYVTEWNVSFGSGNSNNYCRFISRVNQYSSTSGIEFKTKMGNGIDMWYPYTEAIASQAHSVISLPEPTKIIQKCTVKVSVVPSVNSGIALSVMRGYLVTN